ncbi:MAG: Hpt domain-containing protein, partial [Ideonella sp.]|nr:Hpt domain-containing protein [Ideonella sp.]
MPAPTDVLDLDLDRAAAADAAAGVDLSPLSWVHDELRRTLETAHKVLRRYLREAEAQSGSDVSARDVGSLRLARSHIHQGAGALAVVGLAAAARVLDASDAALRAAIDKPSRLNAALLEKIEQGSFAVIDYLGRRLAGKPVSSLLLFPQTRALLEAAGAERVHPADLWSHAWQWHALPAEPGVLPRAADEASLGALEQLTLISMKAPGPVVQARLSELCTALAGGAAETEGRALWQVAAAVFEAQSQGLLQPDVFSKRLASRLLSLLRGQLKGGGRTDRVAAERLAHDLLVFCAQSLPPDASRPAPRLTAVRAVHGLADARPVDYNDSPLGRFDPALVVQARKRVAAAKDSWSAVAAGDMHRLSGLGEQFSLVGDSLRRLFPDGAALADELQQSAAQALRAASAPRAALAMEVATGLLYLEAALEESDFATVDKARPIARLAERIAAVRAGAPPEPMEAWMETLYARVSDRQTLGTVVQELRSSLASAEQQIDQFFRNPHERGALMQVPATLQSMRGVLSVLGVDQAAAALQHMRDEIESLAVDDGAGGAPLEARFERLAGNLGALGFLIDMLGVQAPLARSVFRFDARTGTLAPLMGRSAAPPTLRAALPVLQEVVTSRPDPSAPAEVTAAQPRPAAPPAVDDDMRQVFIEEAQEVLQAARVALADWHAAPRDGEPITRLRRAFHTLKGSARMVGLADFGEAAWGHEQVYN